MDRQNRFRYRDFAPMPVRVPVKHISRAHRSKSASYAVPNQVAVLASGQWHLLPNLEQRITIALAVLILHRHTVLADLFNVHANAIVTAVFADESAVPAVL